MKEKKFSTCLALWRAKQLGLVSDILTKFKEKFDPLSIKAENKDAGLEP